MKGIFWSPEEKELLRAVCLKTNRRRLCNVYQNEASKRGFPYRSEDAIVRQITSINIKPTGNDDTDECLSVCSLCKHLEYSRDRVGSWIQLGKLKTFRNKGETQLRVKRSELIKLATESPHFFVDAPKQSLLNLFPQAIADLIFSTEKKAIQKIIPIVDRETGEYFESISEAAAKKNYNRTHLSRKTLKEPDRWQRLA